ncbi:MAG: stage VI sporulation protein F [Bacilli bacterium]|jgi:flagellar capping protein FliD|nr:stage VI sporulation protein F [Bacilli bacterium]
MFNFSESLFDKIEKKTNVSKETILSLANKLQQGNLKDETTLRNLINEISAMTGRKISKDKEDQIIKAIMDDDIPENLDDLLD